MPWGTHVLTGVCATLFLIIYYYGWFQHEWLHYQNILNEIKAFEKTEEVREFIVEEKPIEKKISGTPVFKFAYLAHQYHLLLSQITFDRPEKESKGLLYDVEIEGSAQNLFQFLTRFTYLETLPLQYINLHKTRQKQWRMAIKGRVEGEFKIDYPIYIQLPKIHFCEPQLTVVM